MVSMLLAFIFASCDNHKGNTTLNDTTQIVTKVLTFKKFISDIPGPVDTLYLIKSKYYSINWPNKMGNLNIIYIADEEKARTPNKPWDKVHDPRWKCIVTKISIQGDSAKVGVLNFSTVTDYNYLLKKKEGSWEVISLGRFMQ